MSWDEYEFALMPGYMRGPNGRAWCSLMGVPKQVENDLLKAGVKMRFVHLAPDDALPYIGADSDLERYDDETNDSYRARILARWDTWRFAGTKKAIVDSLHAYGVDDVQVLEDWEFYIAPGDGYSRFRVVLGPTLPWSALTLPFTLPATLGSTATQGEVMAVKKQICKWKAAHGYPVDVVLAFNGAALLGLITLPFTLGAGSTNVWPIGRLLPQTLPFTLGGLDC